MQTCDNCGCEVDKEPLVLCDECEGTAEADALRAKLDRTKQHMATALDEKETEGRALWGEQESEIAALRAKLAEVERLTKEIEAGRATWHNALEGHWALVHARDAAIERADKADARLAVMRAEVDKLREALRVAEEQWEKTEDERDALRAKLDEAEARAARCAPLEAAVRRLPHAVQRVFDFARAQGYHDNMLLPAYDALGCDPPGTTLRSPAPAPAPDRAKPRPATGRRCAACGACEVVDLLSDDLSIWSAEECVACGACWRNDPPRPAHEATHARTREWIDMVRTQLVLCRLPVPAPHAEGGGDEDGTAPPTPEDAGGVGPSTWLREGVTVYTLQHAGWSKGVEQHSNRLSLRVQHYKPATEAEAEAVAARIVDALNAGPPAEVAGGVARDVEDALRGIVDAYDRTVTQLSARLGIAQVPAAFELREHLAAIRAAVRTPGAAMPPTTEDANARED